MLSNIRTLALAAALGLVAAASVASVAAGDGKPNDPLSNEEGYIGSFSWGMDQIRVYGAWEVTHGAGVTVAIVDTGIDLDHPDLAANVVPGVDFVDCQDLVNGCGDGHWDPDGDGLGSIHGTLVAGVVAAAADNGIGVFGVAPEARLMPVRVTGDDGTNIPSEVLAGMRWAVDHGADVLNLSFTSTFDSLLGDPGFEEAVQYAVDHGVTVVGGAGNRGVPVCERPSFLTGVLCAIATDPFEARAAYSSGGIGEDDFSVVAAPGGQLVTACEDAMKTPDLAIVSTTPDELPPSVCLPYATPAGYDVDGGTSYAAPHVAGVAALLHAAGCDRWQVMELLRTTSRQPVSDERSTFTPVYGWGIVDASAAMTAAADVCARRA